MRIKKNQFNIIKYFEYLYSNENKMFVILCCVHTACEASQSLVVVTCQKVCNFKHVIGFTFWLIDFFFFLRPNIYLTNLYYKDMSLDKNSYKHKILLFVFQMLEEWMRNSPNEGPNLREKSILLVKIMQHIEKKFPDLNAQYLDIIIYIYR